MLFASPSNKGSRSFLQKQRADCIHQYLDILIDKKILKQMYPFSIVKRASFLHEVKLIPIATIEKKSSLSLNAIFAKKNSNYLSCNICQKEFKFYFKCNICQKEI